jgi:hypothetical protein
MNLRQWMNWIGREGKRVAITVVGFTLVIAGLVLIVFPGPFTIPLIIAGLAVLATEYAWARRALDEAKEKGRKARDRFFKRRR